MFPGQVRHKSENGKLYGVGPGESGGLELETAEVEGFPNVWVRVHIHGHHQGSQGVESFRN